MRSCGRLCTANEQGLDDPNWGIDIANEEFKSGVFDEMRKITMPKMLLESIATSKAGLVEAEKTGDADKIEELRASIANAEKDLQKLGRENPQSAAELAKQTINASIDESFGAMSESVNTFLAECKKRQTKKQKKL